MSRTVAFHHCIATSSGESEIYATAGAAVDAIHMRRVLEFLGYACHLRLKLDATVAMAWLSRQGVGKLRHIDTRVLWLQKAAEEAKIVAVKVPTEHHVADLGTKALAEKRLHHMLDLAGMIKIDEEKEKSTEVDKVATIDKVMATRAVRAMVASIVAGTSLAREDCAVTVMQSGIILKDFEGDWFWTMIKIAFVMSMVMLMGTCCITAVLIKKFGGPLREEVFPLCAR